MLDAFVPRWTRRFAFASSRPFSICRPWWFAAAPPDGEPGPIWISAVGGGLGSRGELGGIAMAGYRDYSIETVCPMCPDGYRLCIRGSNEKG